jgi:hypothetical protein
VASECRSGDVGSRSGDLMTKKSPEMLLAICELVSSTKLTPVEAALGLGVKSPSTFFAWLQNSKREPESWLVNFPDDAEPQPFHKAMDAAKKMQMMQARWRFERWMIDGDDTVLTYQGKVSWVEDERLITLDDSTLEMLGYPDRWLRDSEGRRIPQTIKTKAPMQGVLAMLSANFRAYHQKSQQVIEHRGNVNHGVTVVPVIKPPLPVVEVVPQIEPPQVEEVVIEEVVIEEAEIEPAPVVAKPEPKPLSPLQRDLLTRLQARPQNPQPQRPVTVYKPEAGIDDNDNRVGNGPAPTSGVKLR